MCSGFGVICDKDLNLYFTHFETYSDMDCSHRDIIKSLNWKENSKESVRSFIRIEFPDWTLESFAFDERDTLPVWTDGREYEIRDKAVKLLERILPYFQKFNDEREKIIDKREKLSKRLEKYWKKYAELYLYSNSELGMEKWRKYSSIYWSARDIVHKKYIENSQKAHQDFINAISKISGYVS